MSVSKKAAAPAEGMPSPESIEAARASIEKAHRRDWREEAADIAIEAVATARAGFDPARGVLFLTFAWGVARNLVRERARRAKRERGEPIERGPRTPAPDEWAPLLEAMAPEAFARWFMMTSGNLAGRDRLAGIEHAALAVIFLVQDLSGEVGGDWSQIHAAIVAAVASETSGDELPAADAVLWSALRSIGVKGQGFDRWRLGVRKRLARDDEHDLRSGLVPDQILAADAWFGAAIEASADSAEPAGDLRDGYEAFCRAEGLPMIPARDFGALLAGTPGVSRVRTARGNEYRGLRFTAAARDALNRMRAEDERLRKEAEASARRGW